MRKPIPKDLEELKQLLGADSIPGEPWEQQVCLERTQGIVNRSGEKWVERHKGLLLVQWDLCLLTGP